MITTDNLQQR